MDVTSHKCNSMPVETVGVHRAKHFIAGEYWEWCLVVSREATEADLLENGYLEVVGDLMWQTAVGISHCPYCGILLPGAAIRFDAVVPEFTHNDFQKW